MQKDVVERVAAALSRRYGDYAHGNKSNPLDELLYILLSVQTQEEKYKCAFVAFKNEFPTFASALNAPLSKVERVIRSAGLAKQRARAIKRILYIISQEFGKPTLAPLRQLKDPEVEAFLVRLPRVGVKVARCVMMYSLGREVFPVDTHVWRITRRLGWIRPSNKEGSCRSRDMDRLQERIPPSLRFSLHVNMVSLGREICRPRSPRCAECAIRKYCRKIGTHRTKQYE